MKTNDDDDDDISHHRQINNADAVYLSTKPRVVFRGNLAKNEEMEPLFRARNLCGERHCNLYEEHIGKHENLGP